MEVLEEKENPLFSRKEVILVEREAKATPSRQALLEEIGNKFGVSKERVVINQIIQRFGKERIIKARIYASAEEARKNEGKHLFERGKKKEVQPNA